ncbi:putative membrane protein [Bacillus glycinifermentans]|nr:putative membrane protein [Bacillus glycinifermentans]
MILVYKIIFFCLVFDNSVCFYSNIAKIFLNMQENKKNR